MEQRSGAGCKQGMLTLRGCVRGCAGNVCTSAAEPSINSTGSQFALSSLVLLNPDVLPPSISRPDPRSAPEQCQHHLAALPCLPIAKSQDSSCQQWPFRK